MIHKFLFNNTHNQTRYTTTGLKAIFNTNGLNTSWWYADGDPYYASLDNYITNLHWYSGVTEFVVYTDANGYQGCRFVYGVNTVPKTLHDQSSSAIALSWLGTEFTFQVTCTYERFDSYAGMFGLHQVGNYDGLIGGQYESGNVKFGIYSGDSAYTIDVPTANMPAAGTRFNWALVCSGKSIKLYKDGIYINESVTPNNITLSSTLNITLGCSHNGVTRFTTSTFYDVLLYKKALSADDIYSNYYVDKLRYGL